MSEIKVFAVDQKCTTLLHTTKIPKTSAKTLQNPTWTTITKTATNCQEEVLQKLTSKFKHKKNPCRFSHKQHSVTHNIYVLSFIILCENSKEN